MQPVYCAHFGLTREPFNVTPDPSFLYLSASHQVALAKLIYGIRRRRGFVVLTGEVGTGKTTLLQCLLEELNDGHTRSALLCDVTGGPKDLLRSLCQDIGLTLPKENDIQDYLISLNEFLLECYQKGDNVAVIIDEAQNLSTEVLERVRLLSNFETRQEKLLQIVLVGQPELSNRLNEPELRQLKQRVAQRHHLTPLSASECEEYIAKRLEISGGTASLFTNGAIRTVHTYSSGVPRLINILCDNGLFSAYTLRKPSVEAAMIEEIAQDLHLTAPPSGLVGRESTAISPKETSLRRTNKRESELTEFADEARHGQAPIKPVAKPTAHPEFVAHTLKSAHQILNTPARPENSSQNKFQVISAFVSNRFFESMAHALVEALGPMASIIIQDQIAAMGESKNAFPTVRLTQLIDEASREIANEEMKIQFHELMSKEIHAIGYDPSRSQ
jgi:type II secretory pathway predicted ATPase ExeA